MLVAMSVGGAGGLHLAALGGDWLVGCVKV